MKDFMKIFVVVIACLMAGAYMHKCQSPRDSISARGECVVDTITVYDTIPCVEPAPVSSQEIGYKKVTIHKGQVENLPDKRADAAEPESADVASYEGGRGMTADTTDSLTFQLPVTQKVYEGEEYKAYVSGAYPSLDSLFVYPRREIVTIKKPPKRWHIGPTIGYGYTRNGFEPFIGISLTYSIIDL